MKIIVKEAGSRLDKAMADLTKYSRTVTNELIKDGQVTVNGNTAKAKYKVQEGDVIEFTEPVEEVLEYLPEDLSLDIVYEDDDVAVVNKPQGMVVHPSAGHTSGTLVNGLMHQINNLSGINGVIRPGIVHRIDKDTSGLLMVAKNDSAHEKLAEQLKAKTSKRRYLAIVHGNLPSDKGMIEAPIGRNPKDRKSQAVIASGKPAVTRFEVIERFNDYTLISLELETGRTHQIRVHMAYIGHPVAGDPLYGPRKTLTPNEGQFLHAEVLGFELPTTGEWMEFTAPAPEVFQKAIEKLRDKV